jgi:hypothetical protein
VAGLSRRGWLLVSSVSYAVTSFDVAGPAAPAADPDMNSYIATYLAYRRDLFASEQVTNANTTDLRADFFCTRASDEIVWPCI